MSNNNIEFWWASFRKLEPEPVEAEFSGMRLLKVRRIGTSIDLDPVGITLIRRIDQAKSSAAEKAMSENLWKTSNFLNHKSADQSFDLSEKLSQSKKK